GRGGRPPWCPPRTAFMGRTHHERAEGAARCGRATCTSAKRTRAYYTLTPELDPRHAECTLELAVPMATTSTSDDLEPSSERLPSLRTLAAGLANEINTPLTSVLANLEHAVRRLRVLASGDRAQVEDLAMELPDLVETLARAVEAADRVRRLTHDL